MYFFKRILLFFPMAWLVSLLAFALSQAAPGDPVEQQCLGNNTGTLTTEEYLRCARQHGFDKPAFYFGLMPKAYPDTLYKILPLEKRRKIKKLIAQTGNAQNVLVWQKSLDQFLNKTNLPDTIRKKIESLNALDDLTQIERQWQAWQDPTRQNSKTSNIEQDLTQLFSAFRQMQTKRETTQLYIPKLSWHGSDNRYHHWLKALLKGDLGTSYYDKQPVGKKIRPALFWTLLLNTLAFILAFAIAIPLGVRMAVRANSRFDKLASLLLFSLYALPRFWIATLTLIFLTSPYYAPWLDLFPGPGLGDLPATAPLLHRFAERAAHLILPLLCLTYPLLAFIARQMRNSMLEVLQSEYILAARARGISERRVIWRHAFRNALFPIITIAASLLPASIAGSVVVEQIFAIPGMGLLMYESILLNDWPVVFAILLLGSLLTMLGLLFADLLYARINPKVRFQNQKI